jgi:WD40 repeat protein
MADDVPAVEKTGKLGQMTNSVSGGLFMPIPVDFRPDSDSIIGKNPRAGTSITSTIEISVGMGNCIAPEWSPLGDALAFMCDRRLAVAELNSGFHWYLEVPVPTWGAVWSADGQYLAFTDMNSNSLYITHHDFLEALQILSSEEHAIVYPLQWSPHGTSLAWIQTAGELSDLRIWDMADRETETLAEYTVPIRWLRWSSQDALEVYWSIPGALAGERVYRNGDRTALAAIRLPAGAGNPRFSPDGKRLLVTVPADDQGRTIAVLSAEDSTVLSFLPEGAKWPEWSPDGERIACLLPGDPGNNRLAAVNADGSGCVLTARLSDDSDPDIRWSLDGSSLAFVSLTKTPQLWHVIRAGNSDWIIIRPPFPAAYTYYPQAGDANIRFPGGPVPIEEMRTYTYSIFLVGVPLL